MKYIPDPKLHLLVSITKSGLRIAACVALFMLMFKSAAAIFIIAELLGILEELV
jgi:hypothetical protein